MYVTGGVNNVLNARFDCTKHLQYIIKLLSWQEQLHLLQLL